jgi:hypothetical protein
MAAPLVGALSGIDAPWNGAVGVHQKRPRSFLPKAAAIQLDSGRGEEWVAAEGAEVRSSSRSASTLAT